MFSQGYWSLDVACFHSSCNKTILNKQIRQRENILSTLSYLATSTCKMSQLWNPIAYYSRQLSSARRKSFCSNQMCPFRHSLVNHWLRTHFYSSRSFLNPLEKLQLRICDCQWHSASTPIVESPTTCTRFYFSSRLVLPKD